MIYLASPYSHPNAHVRNSRAVAACIATAKLLRQGKMVYSPIAHSHFLCLAAGFPQDAKCWYRHGLEMLRRCDEVYVLMLEGWEKSEGVRAEIELAKKLGKPIRYVSMEVLAGGEAAKRAGMQTTVAKKESLCER